MTPIWEQRQITCLLGVMTDSAFNGHYGRDINPLLISR
jgi:hypothetical protein